MGEDESVKDINGFVVLHDEERAAAILHQSIMGLWDVVKT